jgi:hypothetical protein
MFWVVMLAIVFLAGLAFGLISITSTRERVLIAIDVAKARATLAHLREAGGRLFQK